MTQAILLQDVEELGERGDAVDVSSGYLRNYLVPRIMKNAVGMSPLTVTIAVLIGGVLYGPVGTLLSIPLGAAAQVLVSNLTRLNDDRINNELRYMELSPLPFAETATDDHEPPDRVEPRGENVS